MNELLVSTTRDGSPSKRATGARMAYESGEFPPAERDLAVTARTRVLRYGGTRPTLLGMKRLASNNPAWLPSPKQTRYILAVCGCR